MALFSSGTASTPSLGVSQLLKAAWLEGEYLARFAATHTRLDFYHAQWIATYRAPLDAAQDEFEFRGKRGW